MFGLKEKATQVILGKYLRAQSLAALLESLFGQQWEMKMINGVYQIRSPRPLTEDEIKSCTATRDKDRSLQVSRHAQHPETTNEASSLSKSPEHSTSHRTPPIGDTVEGGIKLPSNTSDKSTPPPIPEPLSEVPLPRTSSEASGGPFSAREPSNEPPPQYEIPEDASGPLPASRDSKDKSRLSLLSRTQDALRKTITSSTSREYTSPDQRSIFRSSSQRDITFTVEDDQIVGDKGSRYDLILKKWRGYNKNENGGSEHGYESISQGHTSIVFKVDAVVTRSPTDANMPGQRFITKLAVKRLKKETAPTQFDEEYRNLYAVSRAGHPNIVMFLGAFLYEDDNTISRNFLFPIAIGNLKQLFGGSINHSALLQSSNTLWAQFEGLASGLQFLHGRGHMVHRDIKPSNILIYEHADGQRLVTKFADFGLAKDYMEENRDVGEPLRYQDVWKLGTVFAELLTYLLGGTKGVKQFRAFITVTYDQITSDTFEDIRYDENKVKSEVIEWLRRTPRHHSKGKEVAEITMSMLGPLFGSPSAADVAQYLADSSSASFSDGSRFVHFSDVRSIPKPSILDKTRLFIEQRLGAPIYWWPLPPVQYPCPTGSTRIEWKWCTHDLYVDLPTKLVMVYKEKCCTIASSLPPGPLLPLSYPQSSSFFSGPSQTIVSNSVAQHHTTNNGGPQPSGTSSAAITTASASQSSSHFKARQLYWCVDKAWVEPSETWLCIENPQQIAEDRILCTRLKESYDRIRGLRGRYLSWKTCLGIKFTSFNRLYTGKDQVICMSVGLPKPPEYEYTLFQPELVHMAIASRQILAGIHDPSKLEGNNTLEMIPKKVDALLKDKGAEGWGLHAVQGWSLWKILLWMGAFTVLGLLFVILWLVLVDPKDLQNAFTPGAFLVAMLCLALGIPQFLDAA